MRAYRHNLQDLVLAEWKAEKDHPKLQSFAVQIAVTNAIYDAAMYCEKGDARCENGLFRLAKFC